MVGRSWYAAQASLLGKCRSREGESLPSHSEDGIIDMFVGKIFSNYETQKTYLSGFQARQRRALLVTP
jgi:hypothetical protein